MRLWICLTLDRWSHSHFSPFFLLSPCFPWFTFICSLHASLGQPAGTLSKIIPAILLLFVSFIVVAHLDFAASSRNSHWFLPARFHSSSVRGGGSTRGFPLPVGYLVPDDETPTRAQSRLLCPDLTRRVGTSPPQPTPQARTLSPHTCQRGRTVLQVHHGRLSVCLSVSVWGCAA